MCIRDRVIGVSRWSMNRNVSSVLSLAGLTEKLRANPKELSGGEQQRVALARALVNRPSILPVSYTHLDVYKRQYLLLNLD